MRPAHIGRGDRVRRLLVLVAVVAGACGSSTPSSTAGIASQGATVTAPAPGSATPTTVPAASPELTGTDAEAAYGLAPKPDPSITYQPDVVMVQGGAAAIRWASADGLTWALDPNAPGAADLKVGSVLFATNRAVGRVVNIDDQGGSRVVTLAPVALNEIFRDANLQIDTPVDFSAVSYRQYGSAVPVDETSSLATSPDGSPSASPAGDVSGDGVTTIEAPAIRLVSARLPAPSAAPALADDRLTVPLKACPEVTLEKWSVEACVQGKGVQLTVDYKKGEHLKLGGVITLSTNNLHVQAGTVIKDGQMVNSGGLIQGLDTLSVRFQGGVEDGAQDNTKFKVEVPIELELGTAYWGAVPFSIVGEFKLSVETAFSGKNSTLSGNGVYKLEGPIGIVGGSVVTPTVSVVNSMIGSLSGITIGPSGLVFGFKEKLQGGLGIPAFLVGPYVFVTFSLGVGQGSVIGSPLAECRGVTFAAYTGVGAGFNASPQKLDWLSKNSFIAKFKGLKFEDDIVQFQVFNRKSVSPDTAICRG